MVEIKILLFALGADIDLSLINNRRIKINESRGAVPEWTSRKKSI